MKLLQQVTMLDGVTTNQTTDAFACTENSSAFQATVQGTGAVAATVTIQGSNDGKGWFPLGAITLTDTDGDDSDKLVLTEKWARVRAVLTGISGTGAKVYCGFAR